MDDVLKTMGLTRDQTGITSPQLIKCLMQLAPYLDEEKCVKVAKLLLGEEKQIDAERIIYALEITEENQGKFTLKIHEYTGRKLN